MREDMQTIVVGVDGSAESATAARWAVAEARSRKAGVRLVHAYELPPGNRPVPWYPRRGEEYDPHAIAAYAKGILDEALDDIAGLADGLTVDGDVVEGRVVRALLDESARGDLMVLGSRRLGTVGSLLGSISSAVAARAESPVVVVRGPGGPPDTRAPVVVGVDGTGLSNAVLEFAFDHASRHALPVRAVMCWYPLPTNRTSWIEDGPARQADRASAEFTALVDGWREKYPDIEVRADLVEGHAVDGLVKASAAADLLVVGARSRHAFTGTLLGSVSQGVLHHAASPVAVIHPSKARS